MTDSDRINSWYQNLTRQQKYWIRQITPAENAIENSIKASLEVKQLNIEDLPEL